MKVIHLISGGDTGGAKTHVHSLLQGLNQHIQADMVCFTDGPFTEEARALGIHVEVMAGRNPLAALKPLREKIVKEGYDIIHCHGARGNLMGALLRRSTGLPVVTTVHSDPRLDYMGRPLSALTYGNLNAWALRRIPYRIGVSDAMGDLLISRGFDPQQMFAIYNGIDFTPHTPALSRREFLDSLGLDWLDNVVIAGIAARLNPVKDMGTLLRGFAAAHAQQEGRAVGAAADQLAADRLDRPQRLVLLARLHADRIAPLEQLGTAAGDRAIRQDDHPPRRQQPRQLLDGAPHHDAAASGHLQRITHNRKSAE